jgi:aldose 1-epimerase
MDKATMTATLQLNFASLRCDLAPALGGSIAGLWLDDVPVLRSTPGPALQQVSAAGSYPLVPFSNRIGHAAFSWAGRSHALLPNNPAEPHAIHGVGWQRTWTVLKVDERQANLAYIHRADAAWPFAFAAEQVFELSDQGLALHMTLTNQSEVPMPAGLGWHPYFVKRPGSYLRFAAAGRWEMGADKLPTHRLPTPGLDTDCTALDVDHCFDGWAGDVQLQDELLRIRIRSNLQRLVVFTNPTRDFVAIEPVSHVNNALQLMQSTDMSAHALGLIVLQPGESMSAHMHIQMEHQP